MDGTKWDVYTFGAHSFYKLGNVRLPAKGCEASNGEIVRALKDGLFLAKTIKTSELEIFGNDGELSINRDGDALLRLYRDAEL